MMERIGTLRCGMARIASLSAIMLIFAMSVSAYTVVMRGGRRVEVPSSFFVTKNTLTYEVSQGVQVTLALAAIDITATEKANNEQPGSLLRRKRAEAMPLRRSNSVTRTITNRDLEPSMRRRRESETAYELKRKQLGLPVLASPRNRAMTLSDEAQAAFERQLIDDRAAEIYWRERASALRTEIAALDAELNYVRARLDDGSFSRFGSALFSTGTILPLVSFGNIGHGHAFPIRSVNRPNLFGAPHDGPQLTGRVSFGGGATRGRVFLNPAGGARHRGFGRGHSGSFPVETHYPQIGLISQPYDLSYERNALITQFNGLAGARAGLNARWRVLEEEARRAGASPGWLRP